MGKGRREKATCEEGAGGVAHIAKTKRPTEQQLPQEKAQKDLAVLFAAVKIVWWWVNFLSQKGRVGGRTFTKVDVRANKHSSSLSQSHGTHFPPHNTSYTHSAIMASTTLHVHVGQCGNQVGERFWSSAATDAASASASAAADSDEAAASSSSLRPCPYPHPMFHEQDGKAAAIFVDSETKVVDRLRQNPSLTGVIRKDACIADSSGRANNWAMGFTASCQELRQGHGLFHTTVNTLRRELERVDRLQSVVLHHSLAGGTGSGVGSALLQYLREACPALTITTSSLGPFSSGDCATQWYNTAFALNALTEYADAVLYRDNDHLLGHHLLTAAAASQGQGNSSRLPAGRGHAAAVAKASMGALNDCLAADLACVFFPTITSSSFSSLSSSSSSFGCYQPWDARQLTGSCCPFTYAKFVDVRSSWSMSSSLPSSSSSCKAAADLGGRQLGGGGGGGRGGGWGEEDWPSLGRTLAATLPREDLEGRPNVTIAAQCILRGVSPEAVPSPAAAATWEEASLKRGGGSSSRRGGVGTAAAREDRRMNPYVPVAVAPPSDPALATLLHHDLPRALLLAPWRQQYQAQAIETIYSLSSSSPPSSSSSFPISSTSRGLAVCANRTHMSSTITKVLRRAEEMSAHGAYLHWYTRHGIEEEDFAAAFEGLRRVKEEYEEWGKGGGGEGRRRGRGIRG